MVAEAAAAICVESGDTIHRRGRSWLEFGIRLVMTTILPHLAATIGMTIRLLLVHSTAVRPHSTRVVEIKAIAHEESTTPVHCVVCIAVYDAARAVALVLLVVVAMMMLLQFDYFCAR